MTNTIYFTKGQKFRLLFDKARYRIIKVSGNCIFAEDDEYGITAFHYDYLSKKVKFIKT
jgi:hypothetical protein